MKEKIFEIIKRHFALSKNKDDKIQIILPYSETEYFNEIAVVEFGQQTIAIKIDSKISTEEFYEVIVRRIATMYLELRGFHKNLIMESSKSVIQDIENEIQKQSPNLKEKIKTCWKKLMYH